MRILLSLTAICLVLAAGPLQAAEAPIEAPSQEVASQSPSEPMEGALFEAVPAIFLCTQVSKTGTCDTYRGQVYCNTTGGVGTLSCPTGYHHVSSSSTPDPCLPLGGACTRTINCCLDEATDTPQEDG